MPLIKRLQLGMGLICFYFHLFFFPAILFFQPIMLNILLQAIYYAQDFAQYLATYHSDIMHNITSYVVQLRNNLFNCFHNDASI